MNENENEFRDLIYKWGREYQAAVPVEYPFTFAVVSRRWAKMARRFGRPLRAVLESDPERRFHFVTKSKGRLLMSLLEPRASAVSEPSPDELSREARIFEALRESGLEGTLENWTKTERRLFPDPVK